MDLTRRELMGGALVAGVGLSGAGFAGSAGARREVGELLVPVPSALPEKVYLTEKHGITKRTHDNHLALYQGYANKVNEIRTALQDLNRSTAAPNQIYSEMRALKANYAFAWGGYINHLVFFEGLGEGGAPEGAIRDLMVESYGSVENWEKDFQATCTASRGWVFVAIDQISGRLFNMLGDAQDTYPLWGHQLVLACDVYEHAYYFDFGRDRGAYVEAFLKSVDWGAVNGMASDV